MDVDALLQSIPPLAVYLVVGLVIGLESLGIPLPGEIILVTAAVMSSRHTLDIDPVGVGLSAGHPHHGHPCRRLHAHGPLRSLDRSRV